MASESRCTRRVFLTRMTLLLAAPLVLRCGGPGGAGGGPSESVESRAKRYDPDLDCSDTKGLWPAELQTRTDNAYLQHSIQSGQYCFNCNNFQPPKTAGTCGTCTTVKGPIQPLGWCKAWTERKS